MIPKSTERTLRGCYLDKSTFALTLIRSKIIHTSPDTNTNKQKKKGKRRYCLFFKCLLHHMQKKLIFFNQFTICINRIIQATSHKVFCEIRISTEKKKFISNNSLPFKTNDTIGSI